MDFHVDGGVIIVNPRGLVKTAIPARSSEVDGDNPAKWASRYGSVTFSLSCRELPCSGINECGLVVNEMTLNETVYPSRDSRPEVIPLQWIQYQLDKCATVDEVLQTDEVIRVAGWETAMRGHHFLVCDKSGKAATVEFVDGRLIAHVGQSLPVKALTNNTYSSSIGYLRRHKGFGGDSAIQLGPLSKNRFVCLADVLRRHSLVNRQVDLINYGFEALSFVSQGQSTVWSIVYDVTGEKVHYRTHVNPHVRTIDVKKLDFTADSGAKVLSINNDLRGDVTDTFVDYTMESNLEYLTAFARKFMGPISSAKMNQLKSLSQYPESFAREQK
jgi:choloylglycine hydrolase